MLFTKIINSPVGKITLCERDGALCGVHFGVRTSNQYQYALRDTPLLQEAERQLRQYFARERKQFDLPLFREGTPFQMQVWRALENIPYGQTRTYGEIAAAVGNPRACRAVGMANHNNPLVIVVPCHRVIGANGKLTGFGGGLDVKEKLLNLEGTALLPYVKLTTHRAK